MSNTAPSSDVIDRFVTRLETLDAGGRARLKRNAGHTLNEARDVYQIFFSLLPLGVQERHQDDYFLIATLYAVGTRRDNPRPANPPRSLGASLRRVRQQIQGDGGDDHRISLDKRVETLLDADREQLLFRLRQIISLLVAHDVAVDWRRLLRDVRSWDHEDRFVQLAWARDYFAASSETPHGTTDSTTASSGTTPAKE
ncbi:MAG TPA: type I-E CRISPR-associated protein Cse2/CasB [Herpetosiphonaceae bacterium]